MNYLTIKQSQMKKQMFLNDFVQLNELMYRDEQLVLNVVDVLNKLEELPKHRFDERIDLIGEYENLIQRVCVKLDKDYDMDFDSKLHQVQLVKLYFEMIQDVLGSRLRFVVK